jgi:hypothetical protein
MPASVHSLADATRKPHENADAVILHYNTINAELEAQLAVARAQRDALRELVDAAASLSTPEVLRRTCSRARRGACPLWRWGQHFSDGSGMFTRETGGLSKLGRGRHFSRAGDRL